MQKRNGPRLLARRAAILVAAAAMLLPIAEASLAADADDQASSAARASACSPLPPMPKRPSKVRSVTDFGVTPNDGRDATQNLQRALDSLAPGEWLVFPPGRYQQSKSLHVRVPNVVLWGDGATLHSTNPGDTAVMLEADGASIYKFTLTAVTDKRRNAPWESRIAVYPKDKANLLSGNVIRGNRVVESGEPGSPLANSAGSAGIFVYHATGFLVAENTVSRSLADGIHVTSGSSYGRVLKNTVKETGDDMIAVVSYVAHPQTKADEIAADFDDRRARAMSHHILIADNAVSGAYWGRGITVVGGENVTIENNTIDHITHGAGIYLARETSYLTFGVRNVVVRNNTISDIQTTTPVYVGGTVSPGAPKTRQGAIEIYSYQFEDESANPKLKDALAVRDIRVENNTINRTMADGVRLGTGAGRVWAFTAKAKEGGNFTRNVTGGPTGRIALSGNKMSGVGYQPIAMEKAPNDGLDISCDGNTVDGKPAAGKSCGGPPPRIEGACP